MTHNGSAYKLFFTMSITSTDHIISEESAAMLAAIIQSSDDVIISKTLQGIITSWNSAAERLFGYSADEVIGRSITVLIPPDKIQEETLILDSIRRGIRVGHFETKRVTKDGRILDVSLTISPMRNSRNEIIGASKILRDITDQKKLYEALQKSEESCRLAIQTARLGTWEYDTLMESVTCSARALELFGLPNGARITFFHILRRICEEDRARVIFAIRQAFRYESGGHCDIEYCVLHENRHRNLRVQGKVFFDNNGVVYRFMGTVLDVTEHYRTRELLEETVRERTREISEKNALLELKNRELTSFSYAASHDLQDPLRKIQVFLKKIQSENELSENALNYFSRVIRASERMQQLIDALLSFSRLTTVEGITEMVDLNATLAETLANLKDNIEEKQAVISMGPLPALKVVPIQFEQLFTNLISNAIKYAKEGVPPVIDIRAETCLGRTVPSPLANPLLPYWRISISDNGISFEKEYEKKIFEIFQRLHGRAEYEGTGIGLAICKKIVDNHKGIITATGEPGVGSVFNIYLPA